jgi:hypothetical protein
MQEFLVGAGTRIFLGNRSLFFVRDGLLFSLMGAFGTAVRGVTGCLKITDPTGKRRFSQTAAATADEHENYGRLIGVS